MNNWIKIESEIFICISNDHQLTIDNKWTTSYFSFDVKSNPNYLPKFLKYYEDKSSFNWEDNKSRGIGASIKFFDIYNDVVTLTVRSKDWGIKDKSYERNLRLDEILPCDKTSNEDNDINFMNEYVEVRRINDRLSLYTEWTLVNRFLACGLQGVDIREIKK